jgi:hypothetical protein
LLIPKSHLARTVPQVYDHVELEVKRIGGNCDLREAGSSRQEVRERTGGLCETGPEGSDSAVGCGTFTSTPLAPIISLNTLL